MAVTDEINWDSLKTPPLPPIPDGPLYPPPQEYVPEEHWSEDPEIARAEADCAASNINLPRATASIQQLLDVGTDPRRLGTCLEKAAKSRNIDLVQFLLSVGVHISDADIKNAIRCKQIELLALYREHAWEINQEESWTLPPLLWRATGPDADESVISWFLDHGADPNRECQAGTTPLSYACLDSPPWLVRMLLDHCPSDTKFRGDLLHRTALRKDDSVEILNIILDKCDFDLNGIRGKDAPIWFEGHKITGLGTPLHVAAKKGNVRIAEELLRRGVDHSIRDTIGRTALEVAEQEGSEAVARLIRQVEAQTKPHL